MRQLKTCCVRASLRALTVLWDFKGPSVTGTQRGSDCHVDIPTCPFGQVHICHTDGSRGFVSHQQQLMTSLNKTFFHAEHMHYIPYPGPGKRDQPATTQCSRAAGSAAAVVAVRSPPAAPAAAGANHQGTCRLWGPGTACGGRRSR